MGLVELLSEQISGGFLGLSPQSGLSGKFIQRMTKTQIGQAATAFVRSSGGKWLVGTLAGATGEGLEEVVSDLVTPFIIRAMYDPAAPLPTLDQVANTFLNSAAFAVLLSGTASFAQAKTPTAAQIDTGVDMAAEYMQETQQTQTGKAEDYPLRKALDQAEQDAAAQELGLGKDAKSEETQKEDNKSLNTLPNIKDIVIDPEKLIGYALNPEHIDGKNKARVFKSVLGYNQSNVDSLLSQVYNKLAENEAVLGELDDYGQRYTVDIPITGPNGNTAIVRTGWIISQNSDIPRLTTIFVK